jgi:hypothetical protein
MTEQQMIAMVIEEHLDSMTTQLSLLAKEINEITKDDIKNNNDPITILSQFQTISNKIIDIAKGKDPYTTTQTEPKDEVDEWYDKEPVSEMLNQEFQRGAK